jgi:wyosine [tRNA(Phe)-imidazoG37] synthetase (radical SAM superfamily)
MAISTPLFAAHARRWQDHRYVYPVVSRRSHGLSIGINLNPDKACNLDCVYCSVDRRADAAEPASAPGVDEAVLRAELDHLLGLAASGELWRLPPFDQTPPELRRLNDVAFSGDGEPTAYPGFGGCLRSAAELIAWHQLGGVRIVVITNATLLDRPLVAEALDYLAGVGGEVWAKLDAGTEAYYQLVDRSKVPLARVLRNLLACGRRHPLVIQSLFMRLHGEAPGESEIAAWLDRLGELVAGGCQITLVQVYTVARAPAEAYVSALDDQALDELCRRVRALGLAAEAFYAPR